MATLLRLATAGSVDDGKSTLIGRLLFDSKSVLEDQWASVERTSLERGHDYVDLSLLTDGLRSEREQGITIDVAYRYFSTGKRKFIIADTPGHTQYTRNMVTGASTAHLAVVLVDARNGLVEQSRRHGFLSSLLGIQHMVLAVNKMDLVDWDHRRFEEIRDEFYDFAARLDIHDIVAIPLSALHGDNVVSHSDKSPWYDGPSLLSHLEEVYVASDRNLVDARFPVQYVIRPQTSAHRDHRSYAGTVAGGVLRPGDEVIALPSGIVTRITTIEGPAGPLDEAFPPMAVAISLDDHLDLSRGDVIARVGNQPRVTQDIDAMVCWMDDVSKVEEGTELLIKHTTRTTRAMVRNVDYRMDINQLHSDRTVKSLLLNEIGRVRFRTQTPLLVDDYRRNATTGSFILIDPVTFDTVGAGMILPAPPVLTVHPSQVEVGHRPTRGSTVWFTGLSASGKSTVAVFAEQMLITAGRAAYVLDGDNLRNGLNADLGFSMDDRTENLRRIAHVARLMADAGVVVLVPVISPLREHRAMARQLHAELGIDFVEVHVDTPIELCEARDPKGLYAKARAGVIGDFTGIGSPYEAPERPDLRLTPGIAAEAQAAEVLDLLGRSRA